MAIFVRFLPILAKIWPSDTNGDVSVILAHLDCG